MIASVISFIAGALVVYLCLPKSSLYAYERLVEQALDKGIACAPLQILYIDSPPKLEYGQTFDMNIFIHTYTALAKQKGQQGGDCEFFLDQEFAMLSAESMRRLRTSVWHRYGFSGEPLPSDEI